jgi:DNA invertase Pin-like site-specific DNA recombinase
MPATPAVAYLRCSSDKQETSIPDQRRAVADYAAKNGFAVVREYVDDGISGDATERRVAFQKMIGDAREKRDFAAVLCWDQDRFGRFDPIEGGYWVKPLRDVGVRLETVAQGKIDWDDFGSRLLWTVTQEGKYAFLRDLSRNCLRGQLSRVKKGAWMGGVVPYGYAVAERPAPGEKPMKVLVPGDPEKVKVVRWLFEAYAREGATLRWLGHELYRRGVPSPRGRRLWVPNTIRSLLMRREYVGDYDWGQTYSGGYHTLKGKEIKATGRRALNANGTGQRRSLKGPEDFIIVEQTHEPLIDRATWERVQTKLAQNQCLNTPHPAGGSWVLTGLLVCGHCGRTMVGRSNEGHSRPAKRYRRYLCVGYNNYGLRGCHSHVVDEAPLLRCILGKLEQEYLNPDKLHRLRLEIRRRAEAARAADPDAPRRLRARVAELEAKVRKGEGNLALVDRDLLPGVAAAVRELKEKLAGARADLAAAEAPLDTTSLDEQVERAERQLWRLREAVASADPKLLREALRGVLSRVELRWVCGTTGLRQRCKFSRGVIYVRPDPADNQVVPQARAALWL